jgi:hypothetical protein
MHEKCACISVRLIQRPREAVEERTNEVRHERIELQPISTSAISPARLVFSSMDVSPASFIARGYYNALGHLSRR